MVVTAEAERHGVSVGRFVRSAIARSVKTAKPENDGGRVAV
jgi:hypothetical protein